MPSSPIDEIKSRIDILELVGSYITLAKAGRNWRARCPFHNERTPSFVVSPERQIWHCFGCGAGGDIFGFVKQIEGVEFGDALRILARRAGVVLKRQDPAIQTQRKRLYEVCELAAKFYEKQIESKIGQKAFQYLIKERGLKKETIKNWRLGWAPDDWNTLSDFLRQRGFLEQEIFDSGLIIKKDPSTGSGYNVRDNYDRFRSRIMFPIFDIQGQVVGFAGRIFGKEDLNVGKYINTPQTILYDKSRLLYGLNFGKLDIRQSNACVFVEGNLDVIMSQQAGIKNTVASSGTALTIAHLQIIRRYAENLIFSFDTDAAGDNATLRSIELALENDFNIKITQPLDQAEGKIM
ncbi:MAG: DNA primase, partial [Candidatus Portnoybacteria bacterium RBG_13_41_18]